MIYVVIKNIGLPEVFVIYMQVRARSGCYVTLFCTGLAGGTNDIGQLHKSERGRDLAARSGGAQYA